MTDKCLSVYINKDIANLLCLTDTTKFSYDISYNDIIARENNSLPHAYSVLPKEVNCDTTFVQLYQGLHEIISKNFRSNFFRPNLIKIYLKAEHIQTSFNNIQNASDYRQKCYYV